MSASILEQLQSMIATGKLVSPERRNIAKGSAFLLIRLLNSKNYDSDAVVEGTEITFGDLAEKVDTRPDGSSGNHYPAVWDLSQTEAEKAITWLQSQPNKTNNSGYRRNSNSQPKAENGLTAELLLAAVQAMMAGQQPQVAEGHEVSQPKAEKEIPAIEINVGDVVSINGKKFQVVETQPGKPRLNSTIV